MLLLLLMMAWPGLSSVKVTLQQLFFFFTSADCCWLAASLSAMSSLYRLLLLPFPHSGPVCSSLCVLCWAPLELCCAVLCVPWRCLLLLMIIHWRWCGAALPI